MGENKHPAKIGYRNNCERFRQVLYFSTMKTLLHIAVLFLLLTVKTNAQIVYSPNTYILIPPTSGCNGVWAVQIPTGCIAINYTINPWGCATVNHSNGDTLFLDLCSIPCDFTGINDSGNICMTCWLLPTGIYENESYSENITISQNPFSDYLEVTLSSPSNILFEIQLHDITGRNVLSHNFSSSTLLNTSQLDRGIYLYEVRNKNVLIKKGKIVKE